MTFTKGETEKLKIHTSINKIDSGDTIRKCSKCSFTSKYQTSVNRHEKNIH